MKPKRIILIRHGQSEANVDQYLPSSQPDYTIELTSKGREQAVEAGKKLREMVGDESLYFYVSPFWRTRSTFECVASVFPRSQFRYNEEPRLREQEWGYLRDLIEFDRVRQERLDYGIFYYRMPGGEAGSDVYDRINDLLGSLYRDFSRDDFPENCILVTHSLAIRLFIMRFFHLTVEEFESMLSPANCSLVVLEQDEKGFYSLKTDILKSNAELKYSRPIVLQK
ncbi:MAG: histidine phosphatase family protein [Rikenellaceae bacterium]